MVLSLMGWALPYWTVIKRMALRACLTVVAHGGISSIEDPSLFDDSSLCQGDTKSVNLLKWLQFYFCKMKSGPESGYKTMWYKQLLHFKTIQLGNLVVCTDISLNRLFHWYLNFWRTYPQKHFYDFIQNFSACRDVDIYNINTCIWGLSMSPG